MEKPPEIIERKQVIKKLRELREQGILHPENADFLSDFFEQEEAKIKTNKELIRFNLERGKIYREAGYIEEAEANFLSALEQARHEGDPELTAIIEAELDALPPY